MDKLVDDDGDGDDGDDGADGDDVDAVVYNSNIISAANGGQQPSNTFKPNNNNIIDESWHEYKWNCGTL